MIAIVDDSRERIAVAGMPPVTCRVLTTVIHTCRSHSCPMIAEVMAELHQSNHWILATDCGPPTFALCDLSWDQVEMLDVVLADTLHKASKLLRPEGHRILAELLAIFDAAIESDMRHDPEFDVRNRYGPPRY